MSVWQASLSCFISDSMHLMLISCDKRDSLGADKFLADSRLTAALETSNALFESLRVFVFLQVKHDETSEKSNVEMGAM